MVRDFNLIPNFIRRFKPVTAKRMEKNTEKTYKRMVENWEQGKDALGRSWEPLASSTIERKGHSQILIDEGDMIDGAGYDVSKKNLTATIFIDDDEGKVFAHEMGTERIPRRPILGPAHRHWMDNIEDPIGKAIDDSFGHAPGGTASGASIVMNAGGGL